MKAINWTHLMPKYLGQWVALAGDEVTVVGSGKTLKTAMKKAVSAGHKTPLMFKVPSEMLAYVG